MSTVADQFAEILAMSGIKRIFGVVGDSLNGITDSIRRQGKIEWIHVRHEEVAAFAAGSRPRSPLRWPRGSPSTWSRPSSVAELARCSISQSPISGAESGRGREKSRRSKRSTGPIFKEGD